MKTPLEIRSIVPHEETLFPDWVERLKRIEIIAITCGLPAGILHWGMLQIRPIVFWELATVVLLALVASTAGFLIRYVWSRTRRTFLRENRSTAALIAAWLVGGILIALFGGPFHSLAEGERTRLLNFLSFSEFILFLHAITSIGKFFRRSVAGGWNPAIVLVTTFFVLIAIGTVLLMLPRAQLAPTSEQETGLEQFRIALFTATSASCVTGLVVVPTGGPDAHWSRFGQTVILLLFQVGGLGIMTWGAIFSIAAGRSLLARESVAMAEMLESQNIGSLRRLLITILGFTLVAEFIGAVLMSGLWWEKQWGDLLFFSLFHSVSSFCNAGFSLTGKSFVDLGSQWQIWGVSASLIILGGLGFNVLHNLEMLIQAKFFKKPAASFLKLPTGRVRLTLATKLVLVTSAAFLIAGTIGYLLLESTEHAHGEDSHVGLAEAWFQSVTFRTAGFNTVSHATLNPATKLFAIALMFIGASPGSTGGGVKTVAFAVAVLALVSVIRGRRRVEVFGRAIPDVQVQRALGIISLGMLSVMCGTILLVVFENQPDRFVDHLFEATSAFATVGVSAGITPNLSPPSQYVIIAAMFLGRVGPLTLLIAIAGQSGEVYCSYPDEQVTLG